jgi:hypothetical protein
MITLLVQLIIDYLHYSLSPHTYRNSCIPRVQYPRSPHFSTERVYAPTRVYSTHQHSLLQEPKRGLGSQVGELGQAPFYYEITMIFFCQIIFEYLRDNLPPHIYSPSYCITLEICTDFRAEDGTGPFGLEWQLCENLPDYPHHFHVPNSCISAEVPADFRAEHFNLLCRVYPESFAYEHSPRYVVRTINGRRVLFDRQYSWTQPVYSPLSYYKP